MDINHLLVTITSKDDGCRIKKYLTQHHRAVVQSKACCRQAFVRGEVSVNGEKAEETRILRTGDVVEVNYNKGHVTRERLSSMPVDVRYQDQDIAIVYKTSGQVFNEGWDMRAYLTKCSCMNPLR